MNLNELWAVCVCNKDERKSHTIDRDGQLLGLALVAHDVGDGAGVDTAVLQRDVGHPQGVVDGHLSPVLSHRLLTAAKLDRREMGGVSLVLQVGPHTGKCILSIFLSLSWWNRSTRASLKIWAC